MRNFSRGEPVPKRKTMTRACGKRILAPYTRPFRAPFTTESISWFAGFKINFVSAPWICDMFPTVRRFRMELRLTPTCRTSPPPRADLMFMGALGPPISFSDELALLTYVPKGHVNAESVCYAPMYTGWNDACDL